MKLKRLMILPFICLVSCNSVGEKGQLKLEPNCYYTMQLTPNYTCWLLFNNDLTRYDYYSRKSNNEDFGNGGRKCELRENGIFSIHDNRIIGYIKDYQTVVIEYEDWPYVVGTYTKSDIYYKGERFYE